MVSHIQIVNDFILYIYMYRLQAVSLNSKTLLKKSRLSDVIYCHDLCVEACYFYKERIEAEARGQFRTFRMY